MRFYQVLDQVVALLASIVPSRPPVGIPSMPVRCSTSPAARIVGARSWPRNERLGRWTNRQKREQTLACESGRVQ